MTKQEALEFLELPEFASDSDIKIRLEERLAHFARLSEKSPSEFLRRVNSKHLEKARQIQRESVDWPPYVENLSDHADSAIVLEGAMVEHSVAPEPKAIDVPIPIDSSGDFSPSASPEALKVAKAASEKESFPVESSEVEQAKEEINESTPKEVPSLPPELVQGNISTSSETGQSLVDSGPPEVNPSSPEDEIPKQPAAAPPMLQLVEDKSIEESKPAPSFSAQTLVWTQMHARAKASADPVAWLIRHTENQPQKSFPVYAGKNYMGRKQQPGLKPFIQVEEDPYVSRVHAALYAEGTGPYLFYIADAPASNGGKASKNGTYVNGNDDRIQTKVKLADGDTVQIGVTKFVLRYRTGNMQKVLKEVEESDYHHTVVIDLREQ